MYATAGPVKVKESHFCSAPGGGPANKSMLLLINCFCLVTGKRGGAPFWASSVLSAQMLEERQKRCFGKSNLANLIEPHTRRGAPSVLT